MYSSASAGGRVMAGVAQLHTPLLVRRRHNLIESAISIYLICRLLLKHLTIRTLLMCLGQNWKTGYVGS